MANWWDQMGTTIGDNLIGMQIPFGMEPPTDPQQRAQMINPMLMQIGASMLAGRKQNPAVNVGNALMGAQAMGQQSMGRQLYASQLAQAAEDRKEEKERANKWRSWVAANPDKFGQFGEIAQHLDPKEAMKLLAGAQSGEYGLQPVWGTDEQGNPILYQLNKEGTAPRQVQFPSGFKPTPGMSFQDLGTAIGVFNTKTGVQQGQIPVDISGKAQETEIGKGTAQRQLDQPTAAKSLEAVKSSLGRMKALASSLADNEAVDRIYGVQGMFPNYPGGAAADAQAGVDELRYKSSIQALQDMRDASKTGGAVGQVTEREYPRLEAMFGNLAKEQSPERARAIMRDISKAVDDIIARAQAAYDATYGGGGGQMEDPLGIR